MDVDHMHLDKSSMGENKVKEIESDLFFDQG